MISSDGNFLLNDVLSLTLRQNSSYPLPDLHITLFNSNNNIVRPTAIQHETRQKYTLELKHLEATDSGTWMCHVHSDSPLINRNISFAVKVLGMQQQKSPHTQAREPALPSVHELSFYFPSCQATVPQRRFRSASDSAAWGLLCCLSSVTRLPPFSFLGLVRRGSSSPWALFFSALLSLGALALSTYVVYPSWGILWLFSKPFVNQAQCLSLQIEGGQGEV